MNKQFLIISIVVLSIIGVYILINRSQYNSTTGQAPNNLLRENEEVNNVKLAFEEDGAKVDLSDIANGCPRQDCIPSIDEPIYESLDNADEWLEPDDRVFIFERNNITRIYPQRIMNWHEIVNDWYEEDPIVITFCPLCGSALAFERRVNGTITEFGVSGKLHNNDLIMYDRFEGSGWQQITGEAIFGPAARRSEALKPLFLVITTWKEATEKYPQAEVLSRNTGHARDYNAYPYGTYEEDGRILFGRNEDERLHPKAWVYGISVDDKAIAFPEELLLAATEIEAQVGDNSIKAINDAGKISFQNLTSGEEIIGTRLFWFAWAAFNPNTNLFTKQ